MIEVDFGIGAYEYWGATGVDIRLSHVSDCCEAEFVDDEFPEPPVGDEEVPPEFRKEEKMDELPELSAEEKQQLESEFDRIELLCVHMGKTWADLGYPEAT